MNNAQVVIVGTGPAGTAAALELVAQGIKPTVFDVGFEPAMLQTIEKNLFEHCEQNSAEALFLGATFQGISHLRPNAKYMSPRLYAPQFQFVTQETERLLPINEENFSAVQSLAKGGLANAWGAGVFRFTDRDLIGFPISSSAMNPFYDAAAAEMGVSGSNDDLVSYLGHEPDLQPPLRMSKAASYIFERYNKKRHVFNHRKLYMGRPRLAVLTERRKDRDPAQYRNLEFWQPRLSEIYTPAFTIERLVAHEQISYRPHHLALKVEIENGSPTLISKDLSNGSIQKTRCQRLLLGAGAINTARIALASRNDTKTALQVLDNPGVQVPLLLPHLIGTALERGAFGSFHLSVIFDDPNHSTPLQGAILDLTSPARSEFFGRFPVSASANIDFIRYTLPAMLVLFIFLPSDATPPGSLRLRDDGSLHLTGPSNQVDRNIISPLIRRLRGLGAWTHSALAAPVPYGGSIHYAGTLPMREQPTQPYETNRFGQLFGFPGVYAVDGSTFPFLPAKNHTFTIMANSMRIARHVAGSLA